MSPLVSNIPVGMIANTAARNMGLSEGIPGLSSALTLGGAAENIKNARKGAAMATPYFKAAAGLAGSRVSRSMAEKKRQLDAVRRLPSQISQGFRDEAEKSGEPFDYSKGLRAFPERMKKRAFDWAKQQAAEKADDKLGEKFGTKGKRIMAKKARGAIKDTAKEATKTAVKRTLPRVINVAFASTVVGLLVTWALMTFQFHEGNIKGSKIIPSLSLPEVIIWGALTMAIGAIIALIFALILLPVLIVAEIF